VARARRLARRTGVPDSDGVAVGVCAGDAGDCAPLSACGEPWAVAASATASHDDRARGRVGDAGSPSGRSDVSDGSLSSFSSSLS